MVFGLMALAKTVPEQSTWSVEVSEKLFPIQVETTYYGPTSFIAKIIEDLTYNF